MRTRHHQPIEPSQSGEWTRTFILLLLIITSVTLATRAVYQKYNNRKLDYQDLMNPNEDEDEVQVQVGIGKRTSLIWNYYYYYYLVTLVELCVSYYMMI